MDFTTLVTQNFKAISYITLIAISNVYVVKFWRQRRELVEKRQKILNKKIICQQQALERLQSSRTSKDDTTYLIKGYTQLKNGRIAMEKDISSNQLWLIEPSLNKIAIQIVNKLNLYQQAQDKQQILKKMKNFDIQKHLNWRIASNSKMMGLTIPVEGYGKILDHEIFNVTCNYHKDPNKGVFTTLAQNIAYTFQLIFFSNLRSEGQQKIKSMSENNNRAPFIMGPVIGFVRYFLNFINDRPLLIEAKFQGGRLLPLSLSFSKQNIISSLNTKIYNQNFRIFEGLILTYFIYRFSSPQLKKFIRDFKSWIKDIIGGNALLPQQLQKFSMLENSKIGENLVCIICYTNCRNTIFFNCKHMIMCEECRLTIKEKYCPLCKGQIKEEKVLTKE